MEDVYASAMEMLALTKLEAAVLGHVCPLNCMFVGVFFGFHKKWILKYFGSDVTFALVYLKNKHTNQNTFQASGR